MKKKNTMNAFTGWVRFLFILVICLLFSISSCKKDDDASFPITNDLRVLQVKSGSNTITTGAASVSVLISPEFIFSHPLNTAALESELSISPSVAYTIQYDATNSFVRLEFNNALAYQTAYSISLPAGSYGSGGESSTSDYVFNFTTEAFDPPSVVLSSDAAKYFEGQIAVVTATISRAIIENVTMELVFSGSAIIETDYNSSSNTITIPAGSTAGSIDISTINDGQVEGEEKILISLTNLANAIESPVQQLEIILGDQRPSIELKGVMELDNYIDGTDGRVRAIHLRVLEDIPNLGIYGIEIASNGSPPDPMDIDFVFPDMSSAMEGQDILVLRDQDEALAQSYFLDCYNDFVVFLSDRITQNGDDAILLYKDGIAIESFGEPGVDGTDQFWEYTDSWAYKLKDEWIYAGAGCVVNTDGSSTNLNSPCRYPFCFAIQLQGVSALLWDGSGTNGGKFVHVRANRDIVDLSQYGLGVANNGGGTDGIEFTFPSAAASEGDQILVARDPGLISSYLGACYNSYDAVFQADAMTQNGDDAIELFDGSQIIEVYGNADVDGTDQPWEYLASWAYKVGAWTNADLSCAETATSNATSACPYAFCE